jgi:hypothetical protein
MFDFDFNIDDGYIDDNGVSELTGYSRAATYFDASDNNPFSDFGLHINYDEGIHNISLIEHSSMIDADSLYSHEPSFGSGHLEPYDHSLTTNLLHRIQDPLGLYAVHNISGYSSPPHLESFPEIHLPVNFTESDIQQVCNTISDVLHWPHIPVHIVDWMDNAAFHPGFFKRFTFDDTLYLNPDYAHECVQKLGSTDIIVSDMAHEIGHSMIATLCKDMSGFYQEKVADFVSGFVMGKLHLNVDVARQWFEWDKYYTENGDNDYPSSFERWNGGEKAGFYFSNLANGDDLIAALKDKRFIQIIENIST